MTLIVEQKTREPEIIPDLWLAFAPVKRAQTDWLVEKATELGVERLMPVITSRTIADRVRLDRLEAIGRRTNLPEEEAEPLVAEAMREVRAERRARG